MKSSKNIKMLGKTVPMKKERGASSLEYLILATVIIFILGALGTSGLGTTVKEKFTSLFDDATNVETSDGGESLSSD